MRGIPTVTRDPSRVTVCTRPLSDEYGAYKTLCATSSARSSAKRAVRSSSSLPGGSAACNRLPAPGSITSHCFQGVAASREHRESLPAIPAPTKRLQAGNPPSYHVIRKEAGLFCRTSPGVRLWWEFKESKGPKKPGGSKPPGLKRPRQQAAMHRTVSGAETKVHRRPFVGLSQPRSAPFLEPFFGNCGQKF